MSFCYINKKHRKNNLQVIFFRNRVSLGLINNKKNFFTIIDEKNKASLKNAKNFGFNFYQLKNKLIGLLYVK